MKYTYIVNPSFINLTNIETGNSITRYSNESEFDKFSELIKTKKFEDAEKLNTPILAVKSFADKVVEAKDMRFKIYIKGNHVYYQYMDFDEKELHNAIVDRILDIAAAGFDLQSLVTFLGNLMLNPSYSSREELYLFLEATKLPITEDGCFIAYKIVRENYMDIYSGKFDNSIGKVVEMDRNAVDPNRNQTCSVGLHFCSKEYLNAYSSNNPETDRCVLVKINPKDVISIPADYNNAKGRCCKYEVVGEVKDNSWKTKLTHSDYNDEPVVNGYGDPLSNTCACDNYFYNTNLKRWQDNKGQIVSRTTVAQMCNVTLEQIINQEK